jgi:putative endonuclease
MDEQLSSQYVGAIGESVAARYLRKHGYIVLDRNYSIPGVGEIDIIAHKEGVFHFIEVKSSFTSSLTGEYHSVSHFDDRKKERIARVMRKYCAHHDILSPRTVSLIVVAFSRETYTASIYYEPYILMDTV